MSTTRTRAATVEATALPMQTNIEGGLEPIGGRPAAYSGPRQRALDIDRVKVRTGHNARREVGDVSELTESIKELGLLEPLVVEPGSWNPAMRDYVDFYLVAGERRLTAARLAGLREVEVVVRDFDERQRVLAMLAENAARQDLDPLEEAGGYQRAVDLGFHQKAVASATGRSEAHVSKRLALLSLPAKVRTRVSSGEISLGNALELTKLVDHPQRLARAVQRGADHYQGYVGAVLYELQEQAIEERKAKARAELQAAGVHILKEQAGYSWYSRGEKPLRGQGEDYESIGLTFDQHKDEECHAAAIDGMGKVIHVCVDPSRHASQDAKAKKMADGRDERSAQRQAELRKNKQRKLEAAARVETAKQLLAGALEQQLQYIAVEMAELAQAEVARIGCELIGLEAPKQRYGMADFRGTLAKHAATTKKAAWQVLMALAMSRAESGLRSQWGGASEHNKAYRDLLAASGYVKPKLPPEKKVATKKEAVAVRRRPRPEPVIETDTSAEQEQGPTQAPEASSVPAAPAPARKRGVQPQNAADARAADLAKDAEALTSPAHPDDGGPGALHLKYEARCRECGRTEDDGVVMVELLGDANDLCDQCS